MTVETKAPPTFDMHYTGKGLRNNPNLKEPDKTLYMNKEDADKANKELCKCIKDPLYFVNNYCYIISVGKGKHIIQTYPKQSEMIIKMIYDPRLIVLASRQVGKTTAYCLYAMWTCCFQKDKKILILANKLDTALEFMQRIQLMYELLPIWIKPAATIFNKKKIKFKNGCSITVSPTTPSAARGQSCDILIVDEMAFIPSKIMNDLWSSVYPVVSSDPRTKVLLVSTPNGTSNLYHDIWAKAEKSCSEDGWKPFRIDWWDVPGHDEEWKRKTLLDLNGDQSKFDQEFGNQFIGSTNTLINGGVLSRMEKRNVIISNFLEFMDKNKLMEKYSAEGLIGVLNTQKAKTFTNYTDLINEVIPYNKMPRPKKIKLMNRFEVTVWYNSIKNHSYVISADIGDGTGKDYTVIYVFDISDPLCIKQVAMFASNRDSAKYASYIIAKLGVYYNNAPVMVERNDMGSTTVSYLLDIFEYDKILQRGTTNGVGIKSNNKIKVDACQFFKELMETDMFKTEFNDQFLSKELSGFERANTKHTITYKASGEGNDDRVMAAVWAMYILKPENIEIFFDCNIKTINGKQIPFDIKPPATEDIMLTSRQIDERFGFISEDADKKVDVLKNATARR